ncbi:hypothetical protein L0222_27095 [bacterium]|nr:hypothetical protein [bacterium]
MKGVYLLALMMFFGLLLMFYSSYRVVNILEERNISVPSNPASKGQKTVVPTILITDPEIGPYITGSFVGAALFIVGAIGGLIAVVKTFTRRF